MTISAQSVKQLRDRTGAGMLDCKKALTESDGDLEGAVDWLRKKGLAAAAKKSGRTAAEGLVGVKTRGQTGVVVEVNSETDFVSQNKQFQEFVATITDVAIDHGASIEALSAAPFPGTENSVGEQLTHLVSVIGENLELRRVKRITIDNGVIASYTHNTIAPGLGRIGVLVALESTANEAPLQELARNLAMHVAAANPQYFSRDQVTEETIERERSIYQQQVLASETPENIRDKKVEGRLRKFFEDVVLKDQTYVIDSTKRKIPQVVADAATALGAEVKFGEFVQFRLGEGIEKDEIDFAAEVAAQLK